MANEYLTENLARIRKTRDLSQEQLAHAAGVGIDTVARIEQGRRTTSRPATLRKLAAALSVPVDALASASRSTASPDLDMQDLRRAITASGEIPGLEDFVEPDELPTLDDLHRSAHLAWREYVNGQHPELISTLPAVFVDARRLIHATAGDEQAAAHRVLSTAYRLGAGICGRLGLTDLAWSSAERALHAARSSDSSTIETAISLRYLTWVLVRQERFAQAENVATRAAEQVQPMLLDRDPARAGVFGNLLFNAATAALNRGHVRRADDLLAETQAAAARSRRDTATEAAVFGPRVAAFQLINHTARADDPEFALHLAETVPRPRGVVPAFWEAGHQLRMASTHARLRNDSQALAHLAHAREMASDWARRQPLGHATMRQLTERATRRRGPVFADLTVHYGVSDEVTP